MPRRAAPAISLKSIATSVDSAIKLAAARQSIAVDKETIIHRWEIFGRRLRNVTDVDIAYNFASEVSRRVTLHGLDVEPIVTRTGKDVFVGFIEKSSTPKVLSR